MKKKEIDAVIRKILHFSKVSREHGLLATIPLIDKKALEDRSNLFEYGMTMVDDGYDAVIIEDILKSISRLRSYSWDQPIIDSLSIIGVLSIQAGDNPNILLQRLDSHIPEQYRSEWLKKRVTEILLNAVNEEGYPRVWIHPEDAKTEFEKLGILTDRQIQMMMREIDSETIAQALCGKENERMKNVFLSNMNHRAAEMIEVDIKNIQGTKTFQAQKKMLDVAEKLKFINT
jgi:hypothetical protein